MSNAQKFLLGAVGLIVVVLLCGVIIVIMNKGRSSMNNSMDSYDNMVAQFDDIKYTQFEGGIASGADVINLVKNLKNGEGISVVVTNKAGASVTYTNTTGTVTGSASGTTYTLTDVSDKSKAAYINALASFDGSVTRNTAGAVTSVVFVQR